MITHPSITPPRQTRTLRWTGTTCAHSQTRKWDPGFDLSVTHATRSQGLVTTVKSEHALIPAMDNAVKRRGASCLAHPNYPRMSPAPPSGARLHILVARIDQKKPLSITEESLFFVCKAKQSKELNSPPELPNLWAAVIGVELNKDATSNPLLFLLLHTPPQLTPCNCVHPALSRGKLG